MDSSRDVTGSFKDFPPEGANPPPAKRGKKEPQGPEEEKVAEVAQNVFEEEDEDTYTTPMSPKLHSLKRERGDEAEGEQKSGAVVSASKRGKEKTRKAIREILPYISRFPDETTPLVRDVQDIALQNSLKTAADTLFTSVANKDIRDEVITLAVEIPAEQRVQFIELADFYIKFSEETLSFLAKIPVDQRVGCMVGLREYFDGDMKKEILSIIDSLKCDVLQHTLSRVQSFTSDILSIKSCVLPYYSIFRKRVVRMRIVTSAFYAASWSN